MEDGLLICRCEEITKAEIQAAIRAHDLRTIQEVKRLTRAGMGLCQGKTCGCLVMDILARETGQARSQVRPDTSRPPVRPVPIELLANSAHGDD